jgi:hypothetical protein
MRGNPNLVPRRGGDYAGFGNKFMEAVVIYWADFGMILNDPTVSLPY